LIERHTFDGCQCKDPDFAAEYLKAALEDEDELRVLLIALRHLAQAQGIAKVAKAAGIERESLYRALSVHGNPRLSTLVAVTKAIGLRLTVEAAQWVNNPDRGTSWKNGARTRNHKIGSKLVPTMGRKTGILSV